MMMRPMSSVTSGSKACDRTCPPPAKQRDTVPLTKSTATIPTVMLLSLEIGRIEKEWAEEAKGRRRRVRKWRG
jgi:hypothetical protein